MYSNIYDFCKVRNLGNCFKNGVDPTPRVQFLTDLIESLSIEYELDTFSYSEDIEKVSSKSKNNFFNIIMPGSSNKMVVAHHDIANPASDNANDNSASCINAIALKRLVPDLNVILLDGEEVGGIGSEHAAEQIKVGDFGSIDWVLNLELTGRGGDLFFIGNYPGALSNLILSQFECPVFDTPFNDSVLFRRHGIDSTVINPLPKKVKGSRGPSVKMNGFDLDVSILYLCHSMEDSADKINDADMKIFVENVLQKIVTS